MASRPRILRFGIPILLGVFAALGHEAWASGVWTTFVALIISGLLLPASSRISARFGWLFGLGYFAFTLRWIIEPFLVDIARHGWMAPFAIVLMAGGLALFWGAAFWAARWIGGARGLLWLPVTLGLAELARAYVFTGFPWGMVSYTLIGGPMDIWLAWVGPHGGNVVLVTSASIAAYAVQRGGWVKWMPFAAIVVATFALQVISATTMPMTSQTVRIIQPNAPQHQKWDIDWMPVFFDRAVELTRAGTPVDVVIWPETSVPTLLEYADPWFEQMSLAANGAPVVAGIQRRAGAAYHNSLVVVDGPGSVAALYDKTHLVPFGEYVPLAAWLRPLGLGPLVDQVAGFAPGQGDGLIQIDGLGLARVLICYEGIFPQEMTRGEARPEVLLIITNDAWFGSGPGPRQHLQQARARAIEQGLPVIRSANTGISAVIDARGVVAASLPLNTAGALDAMVPAPLPPTLYARTGDMPLMVLLGLLALAGVASRKRLTVDGAADHS